MYLSCCVCVCVCVFMCVFVSVFVCEGCLSFPFTGTVRLSVYWNAVFLIPVMSLLSGDHFENMCVLQCMCVCVCLCGRVTRHTHTTHIMSVEMFVCLVRPNAH